MCVCLNLIYFCEFAALKSKLPLASSHLVLVVVKKKKRIILPAIYSHFFYLSFNRRISEGNCASVFVFSDSFFFFFIAFQFYVETSKKKKKKKLIRTFYYFFFFFFQN